MKKWLLITLPIPVLLYLFFSSDETKKSKDVTVENQPVQKSNPVDTLGSDEVSSVPTVTPRTESENRLVEDLASSYDQKSKLIKRTKRRVEKESRYQKLQRKRAFKLSQKRRLYEYKQRVEERKRVQRERQKFIAFKQERKRFTSGSRPLQSRHRQLFIEEKRKELIRNQFFEKRREL